MDQENQVAQPGFSIIEGIISQGLELYDAPITEAKVKRMSLASALQKYRINMGNFKKLDTL